MRKVTLDDVKKFHQQFYGASHGVLLVVGQFDRAALEKTAQEALGAWNSAAPYHAHGDTIQEGPSRQI